MIIPLFVKTQDFGSKIIPLIYPRTYVLCSYRMKHIFQDHCRVNGNGYTSKGHHSDMKEFAFLSRRLGATPKGKNLSKFFPFREALF